MGTDDRGRGSGRYDGDVLAKWEAEKAARRAPAPTVPANAGMVVQHRASGFVGTVASIDRISVRLLGDDGIQREFRLLPGAFVVERRAVSLERPVAAPDRSGDSFALTPSGSIAVAHSARVARASRILVEGVHDAELVEQVWGDDLREVGVVVERLDGIDHLGEVVRTFGPRHGRRLGVLVDHLVAGSKEARLTAAFESPYLLVTGTPYVDIWQAIRPNVAGIERWPAIPRELDWKTEMARLLGHADVGSCWRRLKASVRSYADLEPALVGAVEQLIDFVTLED